MGLDNGDKAIVKGIVVDEVKECPTGKAVIDDINRIDRRVEQMQHETKKTVSKIYEKVDGNNRESNNRWFTVLLAILGQFLALIFGLVFIIMKIKGLD